MLQFWTIYCLSNINIWQYIAQQYIARAIYCPSNININIENQIDLYPWTAEELRNINDEREKLITENSHLKKERFEEEIALKDRNDVISMALKELEDLERQLRLFNNAKSLHLLSL